MSLGEEGLGLEEEGPPVSPQEAGLELARQEARSWSAAVARGEAQA